MTDEPTKNPSDQLPPTPTPPPSEESGVGFAAIRLPGQQPPSAPLPGQEPGYANPYQPPATPQGYEPTSPLSGPPPGSPPSSPPASPPPPLAPPPGPDYKYDYSRIPVRRSQGPSVLLVGVLAFALVLAVGLGAMYALGVGLFARAVPTPAPTLIAHPTPTVVPVGTETAGPIVSAAPTASGGVPSATPIGDPVAALRSHIPSAIVESCFISAPDDPVAILAIATCDADDGEIRVTYFQYAAYDTMFSAYSGFRIASQIEPDSGDCDDLATWPSENSYNIDGVTAGRLLCTQELNETSLYWTDDRLNILSQATHNHGDYERLIEFWTSESGPDL